MKSYLKKKITQNLSCYSSLSGAKLKKIFSILSTFKTWCLKSELRIILHLINFNSHRLLSWIWLHFIPNYGNFTYQPSFSNHSKANGAQWSVHFFKGDNCDFACFNTFHKYVSLWGYPFLFKSQKWHNMFPIQVIINRLV